MQVNNFKAIDKLFCGGKEKKNIPQFYHVILSALGSVPHLVSSLSNRSGAWFYLAATKKEKRWSWVVVVVDVLFLSCWLFVFSFFYLTLWNPAFLSRLKILHLPVSLVQAKPGLSSWKLSLDPCLALYWRAFKLLTWQTFSFIGTRYPPVTSPKLALWVQRS